MQNFNKNFSFGLKICYQMPFDMPVYHNYSFHMSKKTEQLCLDHSETDNAHEISNLVRRF